MDPCKWGSEVQTILCILLVNRYVHFEDLEKEDIEDISWKYRDAVDMLKAINRANYQVPQDMR